MIVTVTLNAALDRTLTVPHFLRGQRHRASQVLTLAGGKGINVARALKRLDVPVVATGLAGGRTGTRIVEELTGEAILNDFVRIGEESRTSTAVVDPTESTYTEINEWGPKVTSEELEMLLEKLHYLSRGADFVVFAGSLPRGVEESFYAEAVRDLNRKGVPVVLDTEGEPLRLGTEAEPFLVSPNQREAEHVVGQELEEEEDFLMALDTIAELGARNVHITLESGSYALFREDRQVRRYKALAPTVEAVSVVGAGDVLLAQFIAAQLAGKSSEDALRLAVAAGAASTLEVGAGRFDPRDAGRLVAGVELAELAPVGSRPSRQPVTLSSLEGQELSFDEKFGREGLTFDDVLLVPAESSVLPNDVRTATRLTRTIALEIPIVSAAMDTVTEARLAIALAREGGIGIIHRNLSIADQVAEVDKVKRSESGMIVEPVTLPARRLGRRGARADGALPDLGRADHRRRGRARRHPDQPRPALRDERAQPVSALMTARDLVTAPVGTTLDEANAILHRHKIEKLPVVDADGRLTGLITVKDIQQADRVPARDQGRAGAAARRRRRRRRHGRVRARRRARRRRGRRARRRHRARPLARRSSRWCGGCKAEWDVQVIAGNVATAEAAEALIDAGADAVKFGIGPGLDLHDARRRRRRRAADHGDLRVRRGRAPARRPGDRGRRHDLLGRHRQGDRRRRGHASCSARCSPASTRARAT